MKTEILFGVHPVLEAFRANRRDIIEIFVMGEKRSKRLEEIVERAEAYQIPVRRMSPES